MDIVAERNAFGRQLHSFEEDLEFPGIDGGPVRAVFIRAPWISEHGPGVEVLAEVDGHPVAAREGDALRHLLPSRSSATTAACTRRSSRRSARRATRE